jgi:pimeloyl-ACP methyl ester carboxylesterase
LNTSRGSRIPAFFIERPNAQVTILFSHGNAEDLGMIYDWFNDLARVLRVNIMAYDYTGYGKSNGVPQEDSCYADIEAAYQYLLEVRRVQPEQVVLYGRSLGSGPSCYLAAKSAKEGQSVGGVILQSPLLSAYRVAFDFRFTMVGDKVRAVESDLWNHRARVPVLTCRLCSSQTLIVHRIFDAPFLLCTGHKMKSCRFGMVKTCSWPCHKNGEQSHFGSMELVTTTLKLCFDRRVLLSTNSMNSWTCT